MSDLTNTQYYALLFGLLVVLPLFQVFMGTMAQEQWADGAKRDAVVCGIACLFPVLHIISLFYHVEGGEAIHWQVQSEAICVLINIALNWLPFTLGILLNKRFKLFSKLLD